MRRVRPAVLAALACAAAAIAPPVASGDGAASLVEREFAAAIRTVTPATVFIVAKASLGPSPGSSGVIVTSSGYVLSDKDAGGYGRARTGPDGKPVVRGGRPEMEFVHADEVEVRLPDLKHGTYEVFPAKVVRRVPELDSTLLKITAPPGRTFPAVVPGDSDGLDVGHFAFAMGMTFPNPNSTGGSASLTGGVVSALIPQPTGAAGGKWAEVYTSAAVNPGVNGGPLVDVEGRLIAIISTWGAVEDANPFQFLGKAYPIERLRHAYRDVPNASTIFPDARSGGTRSRQADLLEAAFTAVAMRTYPSVVGIESASPPRYAMRAPVGRGRFVDLPRYRGPFSGVVASEDGWIVTSLYNLADVIPLVFLGLPNRVEETLGQWKDLTVRFPGGPSVPARIVAHDQRAGIALLKADLPEGFRATPLPVAPPDAFRQGHLLLTVANPFGATPVTAPFVTVGMLSRTHPDLSEDAWQGDFQTDAGATDGTCGGAIVDMQGRLLGVSTIWNPPQHGRNSGIGFGIPWSRIEESLPGLKEGKSRRIDGFMGIGTIQDPGGPVTIREVTAGGPAEQAGVQVGDVVLSVGGVKVEQAQQIPGVLRRRGAGEKVHLTVRRGTVTVEFDVTLGKRPASAEAPEPGGAETPSEPGMGEPGMGEPGMDEPGMGEPGMGEPGMDEPGMDEPGMGEPGMSEPGMDEPGMEDAGMSDAPPGMSEGHP